MNSGIFEIDGVEYPDADASDPIALGWMQGSPPPPAKQIRFEDDRFLEFPQIRWTLSHMRELAPTAAIWRAQRRAERSRRCAARTSSRRSMRSHSRICMAVSSPGRNRCKTPIRMASWSCIAAAASMNATSARLQAHRPHACFSITKSYAATLAATLIHERVLDETKTVSHYLPEMIGTAYEDATLAPSARYANRRGVFRIVCGSQGTYLGLRTRRRLAPARTRLHRARRISTSICARCARRARTARRLPTRP